MNVREIRWLAVLAAGLAGGMWLTVIFLLLTGTALSLTTLALLMVDGFSAVTCAVLSLREDG